MNGVRLVPQGEAWIASGEAKSIEDHNLLKAFSENTKGKMQNLVQLDPSAREGAEKKIQALLVKAGLMHFRVRGVGSLILLEGIANTKDEKDLAEKLAQNILRFNVLYTVLINNKRF